MHISTARKTSINTACYNYIAARLRRLSERVRISERKWKNRPRTRCKETQVACCRFLSWPNVARAAHLISKSFHQKKRIMYSFANDHRARLTSRQRTNSAWPIRKKAALKLRALQLVASVITTAPLSRLSKPSICPKKEWYHQRLTFLRNLVRQNEDREERGDR